MTLKPILAMAAILTTSSVLAEEPVTRPKPERWEKAIGQFLEADAKEAPPKGAILFVGSSSIRMWDTKKWFPKLETINRGFGGSWTQDVIHYLDKIVVPYAPSTIVLYEGDNDISGELNAEAVFGDYAKFVEAVHAELPETKTIFVAIKPSIKRWALWPEMKKANDLVAKRCESQPREQFLDIAPLLLGPEGKPDARFFAKDGLHLSKEGYKAWSDLIRPLLSAPSEGKYS